MVLRRIVSGMFGRAVNYLPVLRRSNVNAPIAFPTYGFANAEPVHAIPGPGRALLVGNYFDYVHIPGYNRLSWLSSRHHEAISSFVDQYGPVFQQCLGGVRTVHIAHADYIEAFLKAERDVPRNDSILGGFYDSPHPTMATMHDAEWLRLRDAIQSLFVRPNEMRRHEALSAALVDDWVDSLANHVDDSGRIPKLTHLVDRWQIASSLKLILGRNFSFDDPSDIELADSLIEQNRQVVSLRTELKFALPVHVWAPSLSRKLARLRSTQSAFVSLTRQLTDAAIGRLKAAADSDSLDVDQCRFLSHLIARPELSYSDICAIVYDMLVAGLNKTSPSLLNLLYCLAANPAIQSQLSEAPADDNFLRACIKESLRLRPVSHSIVRVPQSDLIIAGLQIARGTRVELNSFVLHRRPEHFARPDEFKPQRWLRGGTADNIHPCLMLPFGYGLRACAGRHYAETDLQTATRRLLQRYAFAWRQESQLDSLYDVTAIRPDSDQIESGLVFTSFK